MKKKMLFLMTTIVAFALFVPSVMAAEVTTEAALFEAVETSGTIDLGADLDLSKTLKVPADVEIVLNLNNHTLTLANDEETTAVYGYAYYGIDVRGKLTINGEGTVEIPGGNGLMVYGTGSELTVNGGTYNHSHEDAVYLLFSYSKLNVNGGTFNANYCAVNAYQGTVNITGGTFSSVEPELILVNTGVTATVTGGTYSENVAACTFENEAGDIVNCLTGTAEEPETVFAETWNGEYILEADAVALKLYSIVDGKILTDDDGNELYGESVFQKGSKFPETEIAELEEELKELEADINEAYKEEGFVFLGVFTDKDGKNKVDFTEAFDEDTTWYMIIGKPVENPDTGDINLAALIGTILVGLAGVAIILRKRFAKSN